MFDGWRWRYSRQAEVALLAAVVVGNRIPLNEKPVDLMDLLNGLPLFQEG